MSKPGKPAPSRAVAPAEFTCGTVAPTVGLATTKVFGVASKSTVRVWPGARSTTGSAAVPQVRDCTSPEIAESLGASGSGVPPGRVTIEVPDV